MRSTGDSASQRGAFEDLVEQVASGQACATESVSGKAWGIEEVTGLVGSRNHYDVALSCSQQPFGHASGQDKALVPYLISSHMMLR